MHDLLCLSLCLQTLRNEHVHLVSIEICVVRGCDREVESEGRPREHLHSMTHDTHLMQRWLSVEEYKIIIHEMSLHNVAIINVGFV
jgi:hypothetical protein